MPKAQNPFRFGVPVENDFYLGRPHLMSAVRQFVDNRVSVVLVGPRRFGKTSFVLELLRQIERDGRTGIFIDIFNITSHRDFMQQMLHGIRAHQKTADKIWNWLKSLPRFSPKLSVEHDLLSGNPSFSMSGEMMEKEVKEAIQDLLSGLAHLGENVVVVIDEFQKIAEIDDGGWLEATLRMYMQTLKDNVCFVFTGSRRNMINDMLNSQSRPFYRSCQPIEFPAFGEEFTDWVVERFRSVDMSCDHAVAQYLRKLVQETPNYVQMVCFHLVAQGLSSVTIQDVDNAMKMVTSQNSYAYQTLLAGLSPLQRRALRLAAIETQQVYSKELLGRYEISSPAALASSFKALRNKGILDEGTGGGRVVFDDPLFAHWLREEFKT